MPGNSDQQNMLGMRGQDGNMSQIGKVAGDMACLRQCGTQHAMKTMPVLPKAYQTGHGCESTKVPPDHLPKQPLRVAKTLRQQTSLTILPRRAPRMWNLHSDITRATSKKATRTFVAYPTLLSGESTWDMMNGARR